MDLRNTCIREEVSFCLGSVPQVLLAFEGVEALSEIFNFQVEALVAKGFAPCGAVGTSAEICLTDKSGGARTITGIVSHLRCLGSHNDGRQIYKFDLHSSLYRLTLQSDTRIILGRSVEEIVSDILTSHGFSPEQICFRLTRELPVRPYTLQAMESDYDFMKRLLANEGIFFWSSSEDGREVITFSDSNSHIPLVEQGVIRYTPGAGMEKDGGPGVMKNLSAHEKMIPSRVQIHDVSDQVPEAPFLATSETVAAELDNIPDTTRSRFGPGTASLSEADRLARMQAEETNVAARYLTGQTDAVTLAAGRLFSLDASLFHPQFSGDYLVTEARHQASFYEGRGVAGPKDILYQNNLRLIRRETPFRPSQPQTTTLPVTFTARVESDGPYARLDEQGRYQVRALFDRSGCRHGEASVPMRRLTPYGGKLSHDKQVGLHTPLCDGSEVMITCLNNDPDRPMVVGSIPEPGHQSPVTSNNPSQNILRTMADNELLMDDQQGSEKIELRTFGSQNILSLDAKDGDHQVRLATEQGALQAKAKETMDIEAGDTITERSGNDRLHSVEENHQTTITSGHLHHQAKTDQIIKAGKNITLKAGENIESTTAKKLSIQAAEGAKVTVKGPDASFTVLDGDVHIQASGKIDIKGDGGGDITFGQSGGGFTITPDGTVKLFGTSISVTGSGGVTLNGEVNYDTGGAESMPDPAQVTPLALQNIDTLVDDAASKIVNLAWSLDRVPVGEEVQAMFTVKNFKGGETATITIYETDENGQRQAIDSLTTIIDDGFGHYAIPWSRSAEEAKADQNQDEQAGDGNPVEYCFEVEVDGVQAPKTSAPLFLTKTIICEVTNEADEPVEDGTEIMLKAADNRIHYAISVKSQVAFDDVVIGKIKIDEKLGRS